jgi:hypothetical protein
MTARGTADRSRDYSAVMRCDAGNVWLPQAQSQIESWLREKDFDVSVVESGDFVLGDRSLAVRADIHDSGGDVKITLVEPSPQGTWTTEVIVHDEPGVDDWISIRVTNDQGRFVAVPRVARYLLGVLPLRDGRLELEDSFSVLRSGHIDELVDALTDDRRHGLAFVAGSDVELDIPFDIWANQVGKWAKEVSGLGKVFVLDPAATADFARRVGPEFAAPPWAIRTYRPDVRLDDTDNARQHRILGTKRLGSEPYGAVRTLLGDIARQQAGTRPPDPSVLRVQRRFERLENRRLVEHLAEPAPAAETSAAVAAAEPVTAPAPKPAEDKQLALVKKILGLVEITEHSLTSFLAKLTRRDHERKALEALKERVDLLQSQVEDLQDENQLLVEALDDAQLETELVRLDTDDRDGTIRWLTARLKEHDDYEAEYADVPEEYKQSRPDDFDDLLDRIEQLDGVCFTGDAKEVARLAQVDTNDVALRAAWDAVLVMCDYVRLRADGSWTQGLKQFIDHTPQGCHTISSRKFAETETGTTMRQFGDERLFAVPEDVECGGTVTMKAHFKLAKIGHVSPRMYIHDAHPDQSMMCIGYIGLHLTNTQT